MYNGTAKWLILSLAVATVLLWAPQKLSLPKNSTVLLQELAIRSSSLRSIDPSETDFSDLSGAEHSIQNARVVALGEATHADAATYRATVRFVKFLHERLGFDVLVWEAGILDADCLNQELRDDTVAIRDAAKCLMDDTWASSKAVNPLFQYVRDTWKSPRPLQMAGMAGAHPPRGIPNFLGLIDTIYQQLPVVAGSPGEKDQLRRLASRTMGETSVGNAAVTPDERKSQRQAIQSLLRRLIIHQSEVEKTLGRREAAFVEHALGAILEDETAKYDYAKYLATRTDLWLERSGRDREAMMGKNVLWFANTWLTNERINANRSHREILAS